MIDAARRSGRLAAPWLRSTSIGSRFRFCVPMMTSTTRSSVAGSARLPAARRSRRPRRSDAMPSPRAHLPDLAEPREELLLGALAHAAGVDDDDVGVAVVVGRLVAGLLEQARHPLGVVDVHLAAERFDQVLSSRSCLSLSPFDFRFRFRLFALVIRLSPCAALVASISRALARTAAETSAPPIIRASSSSRSAPLEAGDVGRRPSAASRSSTMRKCVAP